MKMVLKECGGRLRGKTRRGSRIGRRDRHDQDTSTINDTAQERIDSVEWKMKLYRKWKNWRGVGRRKDEEGRSDGRVKPGHPTTLSGGFHFECINSIHASFSDLLYQPAPCLKMHMGIGQASLKPTKP
jgi:hypothetical protein